MLSRALAALVAGLISFSAASTLTPPVLPLIVRNPYLSTWLANAREEPWTQWPMFYTGRSIGFSILASVPSTSTVYPLLGRPQDFLERDNSHYNVSFPRYVGANYDASVTNLTYEIPGSPSQNESIELVLSFLSPVTPTSTLRQAIPASYLAIYVRGSFDVSIYLDVNGEWVSGNRDSDIEWSLRENSELGSKKLKTWEIKRTNEELFVEWDDRAEWGTLHITGPADVKHQAGTSAQTRQCFAETGTLHNKVDKSFRKIFDEEPIFAFSKYFNLSSDGTASEQSAKAASVVFTVAHIQDVVTQFASARGLTHMRPLWKSYFQSAAALIAHHYTDFKRATNLAAAYSRQVAKDAFASGSDNYKDIVELSARQVMGATSFSGTPDNPILFLKEISSNGNCQTVDVIFPAFPFFLYTNPRWLAYLLEPLLEHTLSGQYPNDYTMHDLGTHFPNMTGHPDGNDEYMPVEECGDILIMGLALVNSLTSEENLFQTSAWHSTDAFVRGDDTSEVPDDVSPFALTSSFDTSDDVFGLDDRWTRRVSTLRAHKWVSRTYKLWKQWTSYLVDYSLYPHNQLCTDDFAGWLALQTNLALKGIVGIRAMSEIAQFAGEKDDAKHYRNISHQYIREWEQVGMSRDGGRAKLAYDWYGSWTTLYSLYADALLCFHTSTNTSNAEVASSIPQQQRPLVLEDTDAAVDDNLIPDHIYKTQSRWYSTVMQRYGLPLDSRHLYTKSDWEFQAAAVAGRSVRSEILDRVAFWVNETAADLPFTDLYKTEEDGGFPGPNFFARPVVGSHFAFLALERACDGKATAAFEYDE